MPALQFSPARPSETGLSCPPSFESATAEVLAEPRRLPERATLYVLTSFLVLVVLFCSFMQIDRLVNAPGRVLPIEGTLTVQPLEQAIISKVLVSVGDVVKKGQVLATCDPTFAKADLTQELQKIDSLRAQVARMQAEDEGKPLPAATNNGYDLVQAAIWEQRRIEFEAGVKDFDQRITGLQATIAGLHQSIPQLQAREQIAKKLAAMNADLVKDGYVSQVEDLTAQDQVAQAEALLVQSTSMLESSEHTLESMKQQRQAFIDKWHEDNLQNLAKAKDDLDAAEQDVQKLEKVSELVNLTAPEDAIVVKTPNLSTGAIATDAEPLFSLVPIDAPLEIEAQIDSKDIGFVRVGDKVQIKFDAYKFLEHGTGTGVVKTISQESFTEASTQDTVVAGGAGGTESRDPFFTARIKITSIKLHDVPPDFRITPGMTIEADIIVGQRTIMWYLVGGALRSGAESMHEP